MVVPVNRNDIFGLIRPDNDAHTLGISTVATLIEECGFKVIIGDAGVTAAVSEIQKTDNVSLLCNWISKNKITRLGFSYRLEPADAQLSFGKVYHLLKQNNQFKEQGGSIIQVYFSGLPEACTRIQNEYRNQIPVFMGDETQVETAIRLGIPESAIPKTISEGSKYDDDRLTFTRNLIKSGEYNFLPPNLRFTYRNFGTRKDTLAERIINNRKPEYPPLMRVHAGPCPLGFR